MNLEPPRLSHMVRSPGEDMPLDEVLPILWRSGSESKMKSGTINSEAEFHGPHREQAKYMIAHPLLDMYQAQCAF